MFCKFLFFFYYYCCPHPCVQQTLRFQCFTSSYDLFFCVFIIDFQVFFKLLEVSIFCKSYDLFLSFVTHVSLPFCSLSISIFLKFWCYVGIYSFLSVFVTLVSIIKFLILWRSWCFVGFYYYVYYLPLCLLN